MNSKLFLSYLQGIQSNNQNLVSFQNSLRKNSWQKPICIFEITVTPGSNSNDTGGLGGPGGGGAGVFDPNWMPEVPYDDSLPNVFRPSSDQKPDDNIDPYEEKPDNLSKKERKEYEEQLEDLEEIFQELWKEYESCQNSGGNCDTLYRQIKELLEQMWNLNNILGNNNPLPPWEDHDGDRIPNNEDDDFPRKPEPGGDWDSNGDGVPDTYFNYDTDGDGIPDAYYFDTDGDGIPDTPLPAGLKWDSDGDGIPDTRLNHDSDGDGIPDAFFYDSDGDGIPDTIYYDSDGDGELDTSVPVNSWNWPN
jgi:hypothetical protein